MLVLAPTAALLLVAPAADPAPEPTPAGVTQIVARGVIAAVTDPVFVSADAAGLPDSAWVLAVEVDGDARAYSLTLLDHHEVVNDVIGGTPYAAVW